MRFHSEGFCTGKTYRSRFPVFSPYFHYFQITSLEDYWPYTQDIFHPIAEVYRVNVIVTTGLRSSIFRIIKKCEVSRDSTIRDRTQYFALVYIMSSFSLKGPMELLWWLFLSKKEMTRIIYLVITEGQEWKVKHGVSWYFQVTRLANNFKWNIDFCDDNSKQYPIWIQLNLIAIYLALREKIAKKFSSLMYHSLWSYF